MKTKTSKPTRRRSADLQKWPRSLYLAGLHVLIDLHLVAALELAGKRVRFFLTSGAVVQSQHSSVGTAKKAFINAGRKLNGLRPLDSGKRA